MWTHYVLITIKTICLKEERKRDVLRAYVWKDGINDKIKYVNE
jgi:hypothetical protein